MTSNWSHRDEGAPFKYFEGDFAKKLDGCCALAERSDGDEGCHSGLTGKNIVYHEAVVVHGQNKNCRGYACSPENIADDDSPNSVLVVGKNIGDDSSGARCNNVSDDREKP